MSGVASEKRVIYKIVGARDWQAAVAAGVYAGSPDDRRDGFIHFSTASQAQATADKHFNGQADLVVVAVDAGRLGAALAWETSRGGALFPHLHATLDPGMALWVAPLPLGPDGRHQLPKEMT